MAYLAWLFESLNGRPDVREAVLLELRRRVSAYEAAMIGDDINSDVGGAQNAGMMGILVKTGKYREDTVKRSKVVPDLILESIAGLRSHL